MMKKGQCLLMIHKMVSKLTDSTNKRKSANLSEMTLDELWQLFPIELAEYNPAWASWYEAEKSALQAILGDAIACIDHIGSTAVKWGSKGILAKPIVDILLQTHPECDNNHIKSTLLENGWLLMAEKFTPEVRSDWNKGYTPEGFSARVFHLHIREVTDKTAYADELYFRAYLLAHPDAAREYESLKRKLAVKYRHNRDAYTEAKGVFIQACVKDACIEACDEKT
jgi:GrpB-like predicted nucleotidyltransferase (UPF0157 family)